MVEGQGEKVGSWAKATRMPPERASSSPDLIQNIPVLSYWENGIFPLMLWTEPVRTKEINA